MKDRLKTEVHGSFFFSPEKSLFPDYIIPSAWVVDASNKPIFQQQFTALQSISLLTGKYLVSVACFKCRMLISVESWIDKKV